MRVYVRQMTACCFLADPVWPSSLALHASLSLPRLRHCHEVHKLKSVGLVAENSTQYSCTGRHLTFQLL